MKRRLISALTVLIVLLFGLSMHCYADIGSPGGSWYMGSDRIMYLNPHDGFLHFPSDWYQIADDVVGIVVGEGTQHIRQNDFEGMDNLEWVSLPEGLKTIDYGAFYQCPKLTSVSIPDSVTSIGEQAFSKCKSLEEVKLPKGLTELNESFCGCVSLESVVIPKGVTSIRGTFRGCTKLKSVTIPRTVTSIGTAAFLDCTSLKKISLPSGISNISADAFRGCTSLKDVSLPTALTKIGDRAFYGTAVERVNIPNGVVSVGQRAFYNCQKLKKITVPENANLKLGSTAFHETAFYMDSGNWENGVLYVGKTALCGDPNALKGELTLRKDTLSLAPEAFMDCKRITEVVFPSGIKYIPDKAFLGCTALSKVFFPSSLKEIGISAFEGAGKLSEITIPSAVSKVGFAAFYDCAQTQKIQIFGRKVEIGEMAFGRLYGDIQSQSPLADAVIYGYRGSTAEAYANEVHIPFVALDQEGALTGTCGESVIWRLEGDTLTISGNGPMEATDSVWPWAVHASRISKVAIEEGVTTIGEEAFSGLGTLRSVSIPGSVETVERRAFYGCGKLSKVTIAAGVQTIGAEAFRGCSALKAVTLPDTVTKMGEGAFRECSGLKTAILSQSLSAIPDYAFYFCTALATAEIPDSVTTIGRCAFYHCRSLSSIDFGTGVETIGESAFFLSGLVEVTFSQGLKKLETSAFGSCLSLKRVTLPDGLITIGDSAFLGCSSLEKINIPDSVKYINLNAIPENAYLERKECNKNGLYYLGNALICVDKQYTGELVIPENTTCIAASALARCEKITSVIIPEGISYLPKNVFYHTIGLKSVTLPRSLTAIAGGNFVQYNNVPIAGITIYGYQGSFAMDYAREKGMEFVDREIPFRDIHADQFYYEPVIWAYKNNITLGTSETTFDPDALCTRAQVITFLWRTQGCPKPTIRKSPFTDVAYDTWYTDATLWAYETGVTTGIGEGKFGPNQPMTRSQMVTLLWRLAGSQSVAGIKNSFSDVPEGTWYTKAVLWAVDKGITNGTGNGCFSPNTVCSRAVSVTFLCRYETREN